MFFLHLNLKQVVSDPLIVKRLSPKRRSFLSRLKRRIMKKLLMFTAYVVINAFSVIAEAKVTFKKKSQNES